MKKILSLIGLMVYLVGTIGGFGYSLYIEEPVTAICVALLGVMAFPTLKKFWQELNS